MTLPETKTCVCEAEVCRRIQCVRKYICDFQQGSPTSPSLPLWNLRVLQVKGELAEHKELVALCDLMERRIMSLQTGCCNDPACLLRELDRLTAYVELHVGQAAGEMAMSTGRCDEPLAERAAV